MSDCNNCKNKPICSIYPCDSDYCSFYQQGCIPENLSLECICVEGLGTYPIEDSCEFYEEDDEIYENCTVIISRCRKCGRYEISWKKQK